MTTGTRAALVFDHHYGGYAIRLELGDHLTVDLTPTQTRRLLEQLADAITEWSDLTRSSAVLLAVLERARGAAASDRTLTELLTYDLPHHHRQHAHTTRRPHKRGA